MRILALDIGDRWTGVAISDPLGILPRPYDTTNTVDLNTFLEKVIEKEHVSIIVVGLPTTLRGTESDQTKKIITMTTILKETFPAITWHLWDERFTSQQAARIRPTRSKTDKLHSHAIAAALILQTFLDYKRFHETPADEVD
jgi:putative Holliday junction resolvase